MSRKTSTRDLPIGGGRDYPNTESARQFWIDSISQETGCDPKQVNTLFRRYGTRAAEIARGISIRNDSPLTSLPEYSQEEIKLIVREEKVVHLDDFLLRRSTLAKIEHLSQDCIGELTEIIGAELNWSDQQRLNESQRFCELLLDRHGIEI